MVKGQVFNNLCIAVSKVSGDGAIPSIPTELTRFSGDKDNTTDPHVKLDSVA